MAADVVAAIGTALHSVAKSDMLVSRSFLGAIGAEKWLGSFSGFASPVDGAYLPLQYSRKVLRSVAGGR